MGFSRSSSKVINTVPNLAADSVAATTAYADKDVIGDHMTLANVAQDTKGSAILQSIVIRNKTTTKVALDFLFFNEAPAAAYGDNNSGYALADTDLAKCIGRVSIGAVADTDWCEANTLNLMGQKSNIGLPLQCKANSKDLYVIVVARGAITFGAAGDLEVDYGFMQD